MSSDANFTPAPDGNPPAGPQGAAPAAPPAGLPPVSPPSGKLMMQLFLVPGLIVAFLVAAWLVGGWLFGGSYSKKDFLDKLRDSNAEVRWRAAEQLAQVLLRDDALAADGDFARELGGILEDKRKESGTAEKDYENAVKAYKESLGKPEFTEEQRQQKKDSMDAQRRNLEPARNLISYLTAALGDFIVPVGAPVLKDLATSKDATILQRRQAVWAMANLGQNLKRFDALPDKDKDAVLHNLEAASSAGENAEWVGAALRALSGRADKRYDDMGVGDVLIRCSEEKDDPYLRELSAFAMNFWRGDDAANERMEKRLVDLMTKDDGSGRNSAAELSEEKDESPNAPVCKPAGLQIEYNAAVALARFGSKDASLDVLKDMLDENALKSKFVLRPREKADDPSQDKPNDEVIGQTLTNALKAVAELHRLRPDLDLLSLRPAVDALATGSGNSAVRAEAEATRLALDKKE